MSSGIKPSYDDYSHVHYELLKSSVDSFVPVEERSKEKVRKFDNSKMNVIENIAKKGISMQKMQKTIASLKDLIPIGVIIIPAIPMGAFLISVAAASVVPFIVGMVVVAGLVTVIAFAVLMIDLKEIDVEKFEGSRFINPFDKENLLKDVFSLDEDIQNARESNLPLSMKQDYIDFREQMKKIYELNFVEIFNSSVSTSDLSESESAYQDYLTKFKDKAYDLYHKSSADYSMDKEAFIEGLKHKIQQINTSKQIVELETLIKSIK